MNLHNAATYVLEEVTPERLALVDRLAVEDAERKLIPDNRGEVRRYHCSRCKWIASTMTLHVGFIQAVIECPWCMAPSGQGLPGGRKLGSTGEVVIDVEFFRPLTNEEVVAWLKRVRRDARAYAEALGADPDDEDDDNLFKCQNAYATRLLNGLLVYRNLVPKERRTDGLGNTRR